MINFRNMKPGKKTILFFGIAIAFLILSILIGYLDNALAPPEYWDTEPFLISYNPFLGIFMIALWFGTLISLLISIVFLIKYLIELFHKKR